MTEDCSFSIKRWLQVRPKPLNGHEEALFVLSRKKRLSHAYVCNIVSRVAARANISRQIYPHKLRITNITHMAEAGLSISEIQAQLGHSNTQTLLGYIQHTPSRFRKSYDKAFRNLAETGIHPEETASSMGPDNESYKKMAIKKYLDDELDSDALHSILKTLDNDKPEDKKPGFSISISSYIFIKLTYFFSLINRVYEIDNLINFIRLYPLEKHDIIWETPQ